MADIGGIRDILEFMLKSFLIPISAYSFYMQAIQFLFLVRTA